MIYTSFLNLVEFSRYYVEHQTINYRIAIEVDCAMAMVLQKLVYFGNILLMLQRFCLMQKNYTLISLVFLKVKDWY